MEGPPPAAGPPSLEASGPASLAASSPTLPSGFDPARPPADPAAPPVATPPLLDGLPPLFDVKPPDPEPRPESDRVAPWPLSPVSVLEGFVPSFKPSPVAHAAKANDAIHVSLRARRMCIHPSPSRESSSVARLRTLNNRNGRPWAARTLTCFRKTGKTGRDYARLPRRRAAFFAGAASSAASALARPPRFGAAPLLSPPPGVYLNDTFTFAR